MLLAVGTQAVEICLTLVSIPSQAQIQDPHHFMTCFINPRKGEIIDILNGSYWFSIDRHVRKWGICEPFLSVPVHGKYGRVTSKPVTASTGYKHQREGLGGVELT